MLNDEEVDLVAEYCYVGTWFSSSQRNIFARHMDEKTRKAEKLARAAFWIESYVGSLPAWAARSLYMAQVDPHLTFSADVTLDVDERRLRALEKVQRSFLRRLLGLSQSSPVAVLFTETGLEPLQYRRALLMLNYLLYLVNHRPVLPANALSHSLAMARGDTPCWISDLHHTLAALPHPVYFDYAQDVTTHAVTQMIANVKESLSDYLRAEIETSPRLMLLRDRAEWCPKKEQLVKDVSAFRLYLQVYTAEHRKAMARLLASEHPFAIERLRHYPHNVPRESRICRFCKCDGFVEGEAHVLIDCLDDRLVCIREPFMARAIATVPVLLGYRRRLNGRDFLLQLISRAKIAELLAEYVHAFFEVCEDNPLYIPP